jgi:gliding motility-associated-like protein
VTLTATDGSANTEVCVAVVTVMDTISPVITCPGAQVEVADALCQLTVIDYTGLGVATDNCTVAPIITQSPAVGSTQTGAFVVTLTADDGNGNVDSCSFNVSIVDTVAPVITCPVDQNDFYDATCSFTVIDYTGMSTTSDNCGTPTVTQSPGIGSIQTANFVVTLTADDGNGNVDSCAFNVNLSDNIAPVITCPADQTVNGDASCQAIVVDYTLLGSATDNCTAVPTITQSPLAGTTQTGNFVITLTADDGNGNTSTCTFNVVINDSINPTIACPVDQTAGFDATCSFTIPDYTAMATAADNCGVPTVTQSPAVGTVVIGNTAITLTAVDGNGNTDSCSFNVVVSDINAPIVTCPADESIYLDANCEVTLPDYMALATVNDNCDASPIITQNPAVGTLYTAQGSVTVTVVAADASGNVDSCSLLVTIDVDASSGCAGTPIICDILTPNGDGKNDTWIIRDPADIAGCDVSIYNRWGQLVYQTIDYDNTWAGTSNGTQLPDGAYYYVITCDGEISYKGDLSILRLKK